MRIHKLVSIFISAAILTGLFACGQIADDAGAPTDDSVNSTGAGTSRTESGKTVDPTNGKPIECDRAKMPSCAGSCVSAEAQTLPICTVGGDGRTGEWKCPANKVDLSTCACVSNWPQKCCTRALGQSGFNPDAGSAPAICNPTTKKFGCDGYDGDLVISNMYGQCPKMFACGDKLCAENSEYCERTNVSGGIASPDGGVGVVATTYKCHAFRPTCAVASCGCVLATQPASAKNCTCSGDGFVGVTNTCDDPSAP